MRVLIIIPLLKNEPYLQSCLSSILSQQGDFVLRVHIQTADKSGDVQRVVREWRKWLEIFEPKAGLREITVKCETDSGSYDAIARAFDRLNPADDWIMTWLGADDILLPGALMTVQSVVKEHPEVRWITGLPFVCLPDGTNITPVSPPHFTRFNLAAGFHGRRLGFVMQEGTFWRASLWREAGGINRQMRFAADWDLWRRFARLERLYMLTFPLARFSNREGQISSNRSEYDREIDAMPVADYKSFRAENSSFHITRYWGQEHWTITEHKNAAEVEPLVTIAIVVRNAVKDFADTFQSIEEQTYPNIEIVVVDGASTDGTLELIREREARIACWISEPDEGPYDGMNKAARLAKGRWILFLNAGDFFYTPEAVEMAIDGAPEQADFIIGHHIYRSIEGVDELHKASNFDDTWRALTAGQLSFRWLSGVPGHQATFTRTSMLTKDGGYNYGKYPIAADHEFMYRMRLRGACFYHCDEIIAMYLSGGYSWLRVEDTVKDWWHIARLYGPQKQVDEFFSVNYPIVASGRWRWVVILRELFSKSLGLLSLQISQAYHPNRPGPLFSLGRRVARLMFPKKRPASFQVVAILCGMVDQLFEWGSKPLRKKRLPRSQDGTKAVTASSDESTRKNA